MGARSERALTLLAPDDLDTPGIAGREERVRIDVVEPADEMGLRIALGRSVDRCPAGLELPARFVTTLERRQPLLDGAAFRVPFAHPGSLLFARQRQQTRAGSSVGRAGDF